MEDLRRRENDLDKLCEENREVVKENKQNLKKLRNVCEKQSSTLSTQIANFKVAYGVRYSGHYTGVRLYQD